ncbi:MAG TPA: hypothetical protein VGA22_13305 [Gemmatimonadales bacterium]|jgi:Tol biopolymer transport system component
MSEFTGMRRNACAVVAGAIMATACGGGESTLPVPRVLDAAHELPNQAEYSPDGSRLAYYTEGSEGLELYVANADMSDPVRLATAVNGGDPVWSPDGREIAHMLLGGLDVWAWPVDGGAPRQLTDAPGLEAPLRYHPDGRRLSYLATLEGGIRFFDLDLESMASRLIMLHGRPAVGWWSPDGTRMAYELDFIGVENTLWVADGQGGGARQLTVPGDRLAGWDWSPEGHYLYYVSNRTGFGDIWIVPADSGEARQLTRDVRADYQPWWSPDGRWLAFLSARGRQTDVWLVSVDGGPEIRVTDDTDVETNLRWRPNSTELKYEVATRREAIWALSLGDGTERRLTNDTMGIGGVWPSPSGPELVFDFNRGGGVNDLLLVSAEGGDPRSLVADGNSNTAPRWSPDGSQIVFASNRAGSPDIWIVDVAGGEPRRLTDYPGLDATPEWSADGSVILYQSDRDAELSNVWSVSPEGGEPTPVTTRGNVNSFVTIPGRPELLLGVLDERTGGLQTRLLATDGTMQSLWDGTAVPDDDQPGGDLASLNMLRDDGTFSATLVSLTSAAARPILGGTDDLNDWSPDGKRLVYTTGATPSDLAILTVADSAVQRLTDTPGLHEREAEWSADGGTIFFIRGRSTTAVTTVDVGKLIGN